MSGKHDWEHVHREIEAMVRRERARKAPPDYAQCIPGSGLRMFLKKTAEDDNFFKFFRYFVKALNFNCDHAVFLQDVINREFMIHRKCFRILRQGGRQGERKCSRMLDLTGFFRCSRGFLLRDSYVPWSVEQQKDYFRVLKDKKLVDVEVRGRERWVRVNYPVVLDQREKYVFSQGVE